MKYGLLVSAFIGVDALPVMVGAMSNGGLSHDVSYQTSWEDLVHKIPRIGLNSIGGNVPSTWSVVYTEIPKDLTQDSVNALLPLAATLQTGQMTQIRFVEIPSITYTTGEYSYGIGTEATFGQGYNVSGLFVGSQGNLQTISEALRVGFSEGLKGGKIVDWFIEVGEESLDVYLAVDTYSYGHAFHIPRGADIAKEIRPVVVFRPTVKKMAVAVLAYEAVDITGEEFYRTKYVPSGNQPEGAWVENNQEDPLFAGIVRENERSILDFHKHLSISIKVDNVIRQSVTIDPLGSVTAKGVVVSTLMMPSQERMELEQKVVHLLECLDTLIVDENHHLQMVCKAENISLEWARDSNTEDKSVQINPWNDV